MRRIVRAALPVLVACLACTHAPPPLRSARLAVARRGAGLQAYVRATVAGAPTQLLVDTGAFRSVLPASFARARRLEVAARGAGQEVVDANGTVTTMPLLEGVPVRFDGEPAGGAVDFVMNPVGDVAILSPQDLVRRGGALVIDLGRGELRYEPEEEALWRVASEGTPLQKLEFSNCRHQGSFERRQRYVTMAVNGFEVQMLVDTGAEVTVLDRNNPAIPSLAGAAWQEQPLSAVASGGSAARLEGVPVAFANERFSLSPVVVPTAGACGHGALGADVLGRCTLVWGWSTLWAACRPGGPGPGEAP